jgi:hypothetical protein
MDLRDGFFIQGGKNRDLPPKGFQEQYLDIRELLGGQRNGLIKNSNIYIAWHILGISNQEKWYG